MSINPNTKVTIGIEIDLSALPRVQDDYLVALWHAAQFNPAPFSDELAGKVVQKIGWEIIRRWLAQTPPSMYHHQADHYTWHHLTRFAVHRDGDWQLDPAKVAKQQAGKDASVSAAASATAEREYRYCGADLGRTEYPFTCERRVAHDGQCAPERDSDGVS